MIIEHSYSQRLGETVGVGSLAGDGHQAMSMAVCLLAYALSLTVFGPAVLS